jgi:hypothetical protein
MKGREKNQRQTGENSTKGSTVCTFCKNSYQAKRGGG